MNTGARPRSLHPAGAEDLRLRLLGLEDAAQPPERPMQRHLDRVRLRVHHLGDLRRGQLRPVAQGDQFLVSLAQLLQGAVERHPAHRVLLDAPGRRDLVRLRLVRRSPALRERVVGAPTGDAEQPAERLTFGAVKALAVANRPFEDLARDVLCVVAVAETVGRVRVDVADQLLGMSEGIFVEALHHAWGWSRGSSGLSRAASASARSRPTPRLARASSYHSVQSRGSFSTARRKLTRAPARLPESAWASPRRRHGSADHGTKDMAS